MRETASGRFHSTQFEPLARLDGRASLQPSERLRSRTDRRGSKPFRRHRSGQPFQRIFMDTAAIDEESRSGDRRGYVDRAPRGGLGSSGLGRACGSRRIGAGFSIATTARGIPRCACSARQGPATGATFSCGSPKRLHAVNGGRTCDNLTEGTQFLGWPRTLVPLPDRPLLFGPVAWPPLTAISFLDCLRFRMA